MLGDDKSRSETCFFSRIVVGMISQRISAEAHNFSHLAVAVDAKVIRKTMDLLGADQVGSDFFETNSVGGHGAQDRTQTCHALPRKPGWFAYIKSM
jgi:hypothetical protein